MVMTPEERAVQEKAERFARDNKKVIALRYTDLGKYSSEDEPVSVFMAGSPGAGKTEASQRLLGNFEEMNGQLIIRIDPDEFRTYFDEYTGSNSYLFHSAVSTLASKIHDVALEQKQSFIFDSTFSNNEKARENIQRSLNKGRFVQILYVYQDPVQAWKFVQKRESKEGRRIPREDFI